MHEGVDGQRRVLPLKSFQTEAVSLSVSRQLTIAKFICKMKKFLLGVCLHLNSAVNYRDSPTNSVHN